MSWIENPLVQGIVVAGAVSYLIVSLLTFLSWGAVRLCATVHPPSQLPSAYRAANHLQRALLCLGALGVLMLGPAQAWASYWIAGKFTMLTGSLLIDFVLITFYLSSGIYAGAAFILNLPGVPLEWNFRVFKPLLGVMAIGLLCLLGIPLLLVVVGLACVLYAVLWRWTMTERRMLDSMGPPIPGTVWTADY